MQRTQSSYAINAGVPTYSTIFVGSALMDVPKDLGVVLAIVGYRKFTNWTIFKDALKDFIIRYGIPKLVISGGATGADAMAEKWAKRHSIPMQIFRPDWKKYGKAAGIMRNTDIINACTHVVAFPSQKGKGTQDSIRKAIAGRKAIMIKNV